MTERERMLKGLMYTNNDIELGELKKAGKKFIYEYNILSGEDVLLRKELAKKMFKKTGGNFRINPPFYVAYGNNITIGENFYANYDCIFLDANEIIIGDNCMFGPRVSLFGATHPIDSLIRNEWLEYSKKIVIGNNVWIGGGSIVNPGITIGDNVVIGSGSVITKDIPSNVIAVGNPCKVLRSITKEDQKFWQERKKEIYL